MRSDKSQRENVLVAEDIRQRLQGCTQTLDVLPPQVPRLHKAQHLRRCVWAELNQADDTLCPMQLQPTVTVAGTPRELTHELIQQNEPFGREWYAGSAGHLSLR